MATHRKDAAATLLTALVVLVFLTTWHGTLSNRWGALAITLVGLGTCALGSSKAVTSMALGALAGVLAIAALITGSFAVLAALVAVDVLLWATSLARHARPALPA
jgi:hypothetical protein